MIVLDTHAWVWLVSDSDRLSTEARRAIVEHEQLAISAVSVWEVGMLIDKGRIIVDRDPRVWIRQAAAAERVQVIDLDWMIALDASLLEGMYGDPADRMIVATARRRRCPLVTKDQRITDWCRDTGSVATIW